ncbi:MAG: hypothetical protein AAFS10_24845 [Myxococcota bacterium]
MDEAQGDDVMRGWTLLGLCVVGMMALGACEDEPAPEPGVDDHGHDAGIQPSMGDTQASDTQVETPSTDTASAPIDDTKVTPPMDTAVADGAQPDATASDTEPTLEDTSIEEADSDNPMDTFEEEDVATVEPHAPERWPPSAEPPVTHDVDNNLEAVLERAALEGACAQVERGNADRATRLRCGKWMFFYEHFGTVGIPRDLLVFLQRYYGDSIYGHGFSQMGFVADPQDADGLPIGLVTSSAQLGDMQTSAFTCASCHFGRMPDGRYAVGYANRNSTMGGSLEACLQRSRCRSTPTTQRFIRRCAKRSETRWPKRSRSPFTAWCWEALGCRCSSMRAINSLNSIWRPRRRF